MNPILVLNNTYEVDMPLNKPKEAWFFSRLLPDWLAKFLTR